jgi:hypothetical protein
MFCTKLHRSGRNVPQGLGPGRQKNETTADPLRGDRQKGKSNGKTKATARTTADPCGMTTKRQQQIPGGGQPEKKGKSDSVDVSNTTAFS